MTAEIAIMNKSAVALAADSAVSIGMDGGPKIYNTANKLFALSRRHPVGVMIYGNSELLGTPWETIIKVYRRRLPNQGFDALKDYASDFLRFLETEKAFFPADQQRAHFSTVVQSLFEGIREQINDHVKAIIQSDGAIDDTRVERIVVDTIRQVCSDLKEHDNASVPETSASRIVEKYRAIVDDTAREVFEDLPVRPGAWAQLRRLCVYWFSKRVFPPWHSGLVFAGFGENDVFPVLGSYLVEGVVGGKLKYAEVKLQKITHENTAGIIPFAQKEMVYAFMEGIDPDYETALMRGFRTILSEYPRKILEGIPALPQKRRDELESKLAELSERVLDEFQQHMASFRRASHVDPIIAAVRALPKDELASMAESLVNLTLFKRRVSMSTETVAGPIDVAVISKGDGFIWIKRKHYFAPELNPTILRITMQAVSN